MTNQDKTTIRALFESKLKALQISRQQAAVMAGTKGSTLSQVFNGKYGADDSAIWRLLARWVGYDEKQWQLAPTVNYKLIHRLLHDAAANGHAFAITGPAGAGKTAAMADYARQHPNVYHLRCDEFWNKQLFLQELLKQMGRDRGWQSLPDMMATVSATLLQQERPLIIIDEADKLRNDVLYLFISLYNRLEDHCGLVMTATGHLTKRLDRGLKFNWKGYAEIWSRIGRKPLPLVRTRAADVKLICRANGLDDELEMARIASECDGDLRRVKREVHRWKLMVRSEKAGV